MWIKLQDLLFSVFFWAIYQAFTVVFLALIISNYHIVLGSIFAALLLLTYASIISVLYTRIPPIPSKYRVSNKVNLKLLSEDKLEQLRQRLIKLSGANKYHVGKVCLKGCRSLKPERTSHCRRCGLCVPRMDHHCFVLGTCVHYTNHKQFLLIFFWAVVASAFFASISVPYYRRAASQMSNYDFWSLQFWATAAYHVLARYTNFPHRIVRAILPFTIFPFMLIVVFGIAWANQQLVCSTKNLAFMDYLRSIRVKNGYPCCWIDKKGTKCYDRGSTMKNLKEFFGDDVRFWLWPQHNNNGNPWSYDCSCLDKGIRNQVEINMQ